MAWGGAPDCAALKYIGVRNAEKDGRARLPD
jgi:hypothetical protein